MSEELYNSHDYCSLAEEYEQARNEIEKLQKIILNLSEYHGSAEKTIEKLNSDVEKWRNTALQLSNNHGQARNKVAHLEADYIISNRELLILQVELARRDEELKITDGLLKEATETIGAVIACCTYNSNEDAKIGIYGISPDAFTRIDKFITNYNRAVADGKVSVDVKPVQRPADPSLEEDEFDSMPIEKINQYLREHGYDPEKVGLRGQILAEALTKNIIAREIIQRLLADPGGCRFCDFGVLRKPDNPLKGHDEDCLYLAARAYLDNDTSVVVKRDLSDAEIEELGAQEAEKRGEK